jgi:TAT (twin-arginine translocation) pathway signal sequence
MSLPVSRRTFLRLSAAAAGAISLAPWLLKSDSAMAQDLDTSELASFIGKGLASGVLGSIGSMAFGKIMGAMGLDLTGQAEMLKKLDQILAKLDKLQNSVNAMQSYLQAELSQMQYDQSYSAVGKLVATNLTIFRMLQSLLKVDAKKNPAQVRDLKAKIQALVQGSDYQTGPQLWHDALVGANGQTSLLRAWGAAVFNQQGLSIFDASQAAKIQARWDCFDAQQAMTVWCVVEGYNSGRVPQPDLANATLDAWWENRKAQLRVLRGGVKTTDTFAEVLNGKSVLVTTKLNCLPPDTLYSKATGKLWMLTPYGPVNTADDYGPFFTAYMAWLKSKANKTGLGDGAVNYNYWEAASDDDIVKLGLECGGSLGPGHNLDVFSDALQQHGFLIPDTANFKVAGGCKSDNYADHRTICDIFIERDSWDKQGAGPAYVLFNHPFYPGQETPFYTS